MSFRRLLATAALAAIALPPVESLAQTAWIGGQFIPNKPLTALDLNSNNAWLLARIPGQGGHIIDCTAGGTGYSSYVDGQLLIGNSSTGCLTRSTLTAGSGVTITNGHGIITIAASGSSGTVTTTGSPTSGQAAQFSGSTSITGVAVTGTGSYVKATSPTLVTPALGTPTAIVLTSATGLPLTTGVTGILPVANGGTGLSLGTSGGIPAYTASGVITSTAILASGHIVVGGGAGSAPHGVTSSGATTQVLHGAVGDPTWSQVNLATDVTGVLPSGSTGIEIDLFYSGVPTASAHLNKVFSRSTTVAASAPIKCSAQEGATSSATVTLNKVVSGTPSSIGTLAFASSGSAYQGCTVTFSSSVTFAAGDALTAVFPGSADATLGDVAISLPATQ